jgi:Arc/MetJ-type ribon-helix-helix transcriptional regulator
MMTKTIVRLRLNQQQLELIDKTIAAGESNSRDDLVRRALREFAARHLVTSDGTKVA